MPQPKGEGSIIRLEGTSKADCRLWRLRFNMDDGTRREKRFRGSHTAARRELERFRSQLKSPQEEKPPCPTFAEYSAHWLELRRQSGDVRAQTLMKDDTRVRNLCCYFGEMRLDEITRDRVKTGIAAIRGGENLSGRVLKGSTMNDMHGCFRQIMQEAAYDGIIPANPVSTVKPPRKDTPKKKALSLEEFLDFARKLDLMPLDGHTMGVRLCVMCGLRRGEAVGLDWGAVYPDHIRVVQAVEAKTGRVAPTKTENGVRAVPLMPPIAQALARWREMQAFALHGMGIEQTPETPVVTSHGGHPHGRGQPLRLVEGQRPQALRHRLHAARAAPHVHNAARQFGRVGAGREEPGGLGEHRHGRHLRARRRGRGQASVRGHGKAPRA